jgi:hypothetical protein
LASAYDRVVAQRALTEFRTKRRSATRDMVAELCRALGYEIDKKRGKGSHWVAKRARALPITIPKVLGLRIATGILRTLEEVFDQDGTN